MPEEVFRFSIVRNPKRFTSEQLKHAVIELIDEDPQRLTFFERLRNLQQTDRDHEAFVSFAQSAFQSNDFLKRLSDLDTPIPKMLDWLLEQTELSSDAVKEAVSVFFGMPVTELVKEPAFRTDRVKIVDSLVLAAVTSPPQHGLRGQLIDMRRLVYLLEQLALPENELSSEAIKKIRNATIRLPAEIFPLPSNNEQRKKRNEAAFVERERLIKEKEARIQNNLKRLEANNAVIKELTQSHSRHLLEAKHVAASGNGSTKSLSLLPEDKFRLLSASSRNLINSELGVPEEAVDVPHIVRKLEFSNIELSNAINEELANDRFTSDPGIVFELTCGECDPVEITISKAENNFVPDTRGEVESHDMQELLIVRQNLLTYKAGEVAHIENVAEGEEKTRNHRKLDRVEEILFQESERQEEVANELETTTKYELQTETATVIQEDSELEAGVTVTATYGPVNVESHGNYVNKDSTEESRNSATSYAKDIVSRSVQRIQERVLERRTRTQLSEVEVINEHKLTNPSGNGHIRGIYRWVDKYYEAQVVNYGLRTMLEFMIPEPAAFYKFAQSNRPYPNLHIEKPQRPGFCVKGVFKELKPSDLTPENYSCFVGMYQATNVQPPPPQYKRVADIVDHMLEETKEEPRSFVQHNEDFKAPKGYLPIAIDYRITGGNTHSVMTRNTENNHDDIILVMVTIGTQRVFAYFKSEVGSVGDNNDDFWENIGQTIEWGHQHPNGGFLSPRETLFQSYIEGEVEDSIAVDGADDEDLSDNAATVKVSVSGHSTLPLSVAVHYSVLCERTAARYQQWQINTFNAIMEAYNALKLEYEEAVKNQEFDLEVDIQGRNPLINREIERTELKKHAISLLTGQQYESFNAMEDDHELGYPQINLTDAAEEGRFVRFFEQALEWKHMIYLFYPYFWGRKTEWVKSMAVNDTDPLFEKFLKAGFSRVWVPVRPGFGQVIAHYIKCGGEPWTEKTAPLCGNEPPASAPMVSLIQEIKEQLDNEFAEREGTLTVQQGQQVVRGSGTDFTEDDIDREIIINLESYRIAAVDEGNQQITLRTPYSGNNGSGIGFTVGVKFVGEPWLVQVPTTLVYLQEDGQLPDFRTTP